MNTQYLIQSISEQVGKDQPIMFDTAVTVKKSPHQLVCNVWGVAVGLDNTVYLTVDGEKWHPLSASDVNGQEVAASVLQRVKLIKSRSNVSGKKHTVAG